MNGALRVTKRSRGKPRQRPESVLHKQVVEYLSRALPKGAFYSTLFNGGHGHFIRGAHLSSIGVRLGLPDIMVVHDGRAFFIELKSAVGRLSVEQRAVHADLQTARAIVGVCRSLDDVQHFLRDDCNVQVWPWRVQ